VYTILEVVYLPGLLCKLMPLIIMSKALGLLQKGTCEGVCTSLVHATRIIERNIPAPKAALLNTHGL